MDLQNAFYLAALIFLGLGIVFVVGCIAFLAFLFFSVRSAKKYLSENLDSLIHDAKSKKSSAVNFGLFLLGSALSKIKDKKR